MPTEIDHEQCYERVKRYLKTYNPNSLKGEVLKMLFYFGYLEQLDITVFTRVRAYENVMKLNDMIQINILDRLNEHACNEEYLFNVISGEGLSYHTIKTVDNKFKLIRRDC